jgi:hypothetical protein
MPWPTNAERVRLRFLCLDGSGSVVVRIHKVTAEEFEAKTDQKRAYVKLVFHLFLPSTCFPLQ